MAEAVINIRALDDNASSTFNRVIGDAEKRVNDLMRLSYKSSETGKDFLNNLKEQNNLLQKQLEIKRKLDEREILADRDFALQSVRSDYDETIGNINRRKIPEELRNKNIKEAEKEFNERKRSIEEEASYRLKENKQNADLLKLAITEALQRQGGAFATGIDTENARLREEQERLNQESSSDIPTQQEVRKASTLSRMLAAIGIGSMIGGKEGNEEKVAREQREREILERDNERRGGATRQVFNALIMNEVVKGIASKINQIGTGFATGQNSEMMIAELWNAVPLIGPALSAANKRHIEEQFKYQEATLGFRGATNRFFNMGGSYNFLGADASEIAVLATQIAQSRGFAGNSITDAGNMLALQNAFSLDQGILQNLSTSGRYRSESTIGSVLNILNKNFGNNDDLSQLAYLLQVQNELISEQSRTLESIDDEQNAQTIAAFREVGGSFADNRMGQRISSINQGLTNPQNEYQQALTYSVLSKLNPGGSFFDIIKMQEAGLQTPGLLKGVLDEVLKISGGSIEDASILLGKSGMLGLNVTQAEQLLRGGYDDTKQFNRGNFDIESIYQRGGEMTSERAVEAARMADAFREGMWEGLAEGGQVLAEGFIEKLESWDFGEFLNPLKNQLIEIIGQVAQVPYVDRDNAKDFRNAVMSNTVGKKLSGAFNLTPMGGLYNMFSGKD